MDERHLWFGSKLQETFHFGGYDNPTVLEDFLSDPEVVDLINDFLAPGEPRKVFFYCDEPPRDGSRTPSASRRLHATSELTSDTLNRGQVCLYVLRAETEGEVEAAQMERELFCGELRHSVLSSLASLLSEAYTPLLHSQKHWGECTDAAVTNFLQNFDKYSSALLETATLSQTQRPLLQRPSPELRAELQSLQGRSVLCVETVDECEGLVGEWGNSLEGLLLEATDERMENPWSSPMSELSKWRQRHCLLTAVVEQLKVKEIRAVFTVLVAARSRVLKKWKTTDTQLTDAFNNARDRVHYLECLSPHLEALEASPSLPSLLSSLLPSITAGMKQMEGLSRAYARSGYLGLILTKISNCLVRICTTSLRAYCTGRDDKDTFWDVLSSMVQAKMKPGPSQSDHPFLTKLSLCLQVVSVFKEGLHHLKEVLITQHRVNFSTPSSHSVGLSTVSLSGTKRGAGATPTHSHASGDGGSVRRSGASGDGGSVRKSGLTVQGFDKKSASASLASGSTSLSGVGLQQVELIAANMNELSSRVEQVIEVASTLAQFHTLSESVRGLPRVEGLWAPDPVVVVSADESEERGLPAGSVRASDYLEQVFGRNEYPLSPLGGAEKKEEEDKSSPKEKPTPSLPPPSPHPPSPPPHDSYSIATHIHSSLTAISSTLSSSCENGAKDVFSIDGRSKSTFPAAFNVYTDQVATLEKDVSNYLRAVVSQICSSKETLDIIARFASVSDHTAVQEAAQASRVMAFKKYATELEALHASYEKNKGHPPISHSLPPIAGSLSWCREMLRRVTEPMQTFKDNAAIMQSVSSLEVCQLHNRLSTSLLQHETFLISRWHSSVDSARAALGLPLFVQDANERDGTLPHIHVNCQQCLLDVMAESKALSAADIPLPEVVKHILAQEVRVKQFRQSLQQVLDDFYCTLTSLDVPLQTLLQPHIDSVTRCLLPGCSTLTWNTLNIDAFLHHATSAVSTFQNTASRLRSILQEHVYSVIQEIAKSSLYDMELACSRVWAPREFSDAMKSSVIKKSRILTRQVAGIRRAVLACIATASERGEMEREGETLASLKSDLLLSGVTRDGGVSKGNSLSSTQRVSKQQSGESSRVTATGVGHGGRRVEGERGDEGEEEVWRVTGAGEEGEATLSYVCGLVFNAVCETVCRSHCQMSTGLREGVGGEGREEVSSEVLVGKFSRAFVDLTGQKTVRFQDSQTVDNPRTVLADFAHRFHSKTSIPPLRLDTQIRLSIPRIHMEPRLSDMHYHLDQVTSVLLSALHKLLWWAGPGAGREFHVIWDASGAVDHIHTEILEIFRALEPAVDRTVSSLRLHDFLWREDMHSTYQTFLQSSPSQEDCCRHIERFIEIENTLSEILPVQVVGPLQLCSRPVLHSLSSLAVAWKLEYANFLHKNAQASLQALVDHRERTSCTLLQPVESLAQLRDSLQLLLDLQDLQITIDSQYTPVEQAYTLLRRYAASLPRTEVVQVDSLRQDWEALTQLADTARHRLLHEHRHIHDRETDKQVKEFQVETIRFKNSFDTEGPLVPGLTPRPAMTRLESFSKQCEELQSHRSLLCSVQTLLSLPVSPYPELDQMQSDINHLHSLYSSYHSFLNFNERFRQTLWQEVDLAEVESTLDGLWEDTSLLPPEQQEWSATQELRRDICRYRDLLPLLTRLHSKEVRNRHWLQVMRVTNCTFQLEGSLFRLAHLLEASLLMHEEEIEKIVTCALKELELENEFRAIEEHWNEQIIQFTSYKSLGEVLLDVGHTHFLCESLESAGVRLAVMLVSDHVTHLRDEVVQWAGRLARVEDVLTQWLAVQQQWRQLEAVLSMPSTAQSFHEEATQLQVITDSWTELMAAARSSPGVVEWYDGGRMGRGEVLRKLGEKLELCKKSLSLYLLSKRKMFPRFFYVSDDALLEIVSSPLSPDSLTPHLPSLFTSTRSLITSTPPGEEGDNPVIITAVESVDCERLELTEPVALCGGVEEWMSLLLSSLHTSLSSLLSAANDSTALSSVVEVATSLPCQIASLTLYLRWTADTEVALSQCRYDKRALPGLRSKFTSSVVGKLTHMLMRSRRGSGEESQGGRERLEALAMLAVWLRDIIDDLCHRKLSSVSDFEWLRYPRLSLSPSSSSAPPQPEMGLQVHCLHMSMEYGFEYLGCRPLPVFTPRMNNYIISLLQGMESGRHSMVCGPQSTGKEGMISGIAQLLGRFLFLYPCTSHSNTHTLSRILEGLAQDGGWACLMDVDSLPRRVMGVVCHMIEAVSSALQCKQTTYKTPSGREAHIQPGMLVVLTSHLRPLSWTLPPSLSPLFRTFSLPPPDPAIFLLATCTALGLRAPRQLASKLSTLVHLTNTQLSAVLPLCAVCQVLREVCSARIKVAASLTPRKSEGMRSETGAGRGRNTADDHCSHRHLAGHSPVKEAHRGQKTISLMTTPPSVQPLPPSAAREHTTIAQLLATLISPRYNTQEKPVFLDILKSVFALEDSVLLSPPHLVVGVASHAQATPTPGPVEDDITIHTVLMEVAEKAGLVATDTWITKVKEILTTIQLTKRHILLTGLAATGKTAALSTAASALNYQQRSKVNIHRVYPGAFDDIFTLIGRFSETGAWEDGVCVSLLRRGLQVTGSQWWVCLDGEPEQTWLHPLTELLSGSHTLCLPSGERVTGNDDCGLRLVLETGNLHSTSPASLDSFGVIFFGQEVLSWQPLVEVWLRSRIGVERSCLRKQFAIFMDPVRKMVCHKTSGRGGWCTMYSEVGLTQTCLAYLNSLLNVYSETSESFSEIHVVRLLVFSIIWSFGAVLQPGSDRHQFGTLLKSLTNSLPDDDSLHSVFDYYVDESGEWDVWQTRLPPPDTAAPLDLVGCVYVDTTDSVRVELLLELALSARRAVSLAGPQGSGKTTLCKHFLQARALSHVTSEGVCHLSLDSHTSSSSLHHFMSVYMHHRQGFTYSPQDNKTLHLFIDDIHLPQSSETTPPSSHEYVRQLLDCCGVYNLGKKNVFSAIEDVTIFTALATDISSPPLSPRLQHHFSIIPLPELADTPLTTILTDTLRTLCGGVAGSEDGTAQPWMSGEVLSSVVQSAVTVFVQVRDALRESDMQGRQHYIFSLSHIQSAFQGLYHCLSSSSCPGVGFSWYHEMTRALANPLSRTIDRHWLLSLIHSHAEKLPGGLPSPLPLTLTAVPLEIKKGEEQPPLETTPINQIPEVKLHPLADWDDLDMSLNLFLMRCRQDWGDFPLSLSANNMHCIIRLHHALKFPRGNSILCGPHGQQLSSLARLSLYLAGFQLHQLDCSSSQTFRSSLRALFRRAGLEGKPVGVILTESDMESIEIVQKLNSLCSTGELPTLFSNDEMNGILQALAPSIKKDFSSEETHPMQYLTARITRYLRLVICLAPSSPLLKTLAHSFRGLMGGCHMIWTPGWSEEELSHSLSHFFSTSSLSVPVKKTIRTPLYRCLSGIHRLVLKQSGHLQLAGHFPSPLPQPSSMATEDKSASLTSLSLLMENILQIECEVGGHNSSTGFAGEFKLPYVGPLTFLSLLENFCSIYSRKKSSLQSDESRLSKALETLAKTSQEMSTMQNSLSSLQKEYSSVCEQCSELLQNLTHKSCQVERVKAVLGGGSSVISAMQVTAEQEKAMAEDYEDEDEVLATLLGASLGKKGSRLELQTEGAREREAAAELEEEETRDAMLVVKEEVQYYEESIDRNAIDQIKSLPNPPTVVCVVMQVMLTLLREHGSERGQVVGAGSENSVQSSGGPPVSTGSHHSGHLHPQQARRRASIHPSSHPPSSTTGTNITTGTTTQDTREQWTSIKLAIGDSQHFLDLITALNWREGLTIEAVNFIKSHLSVTSSSSTGTRAEGRRESVDDRSGGTLVTFPAARHAAEVVGVVFGFVEGVVRYTSVYQTHMLALEKLRRARERVSDLQRLLERDSSEGGGGGGRGGGGRESGFTEAPGLADVPESEEEMDVSEDGLQRLQEELRDLQVKFNKAAVKKHSIDQTCSQLSEGLRSATHLMESLQSRRKAWQHSLDHAPSQQLLVTNCLVAATITTYCGPYSTHSRHKLVSAVREVCVESGLLSGTGSSQLLRLEQYPLFMMGQPALHQLVLEGLPPDHTSQQSACIITCSHAYSWPLVCDPFHMAVDWMSHHSEEEKTVLVEYESPSLHSTLVAAITSGTHLIVTGVPGEGVSGDSVMVSVIQCRQHLRDVTDPQKIKINETEVEYNPQFKLSLVTAAFPEALPSKLVAMTTVVLFWPEVGGLEDLLLNRLLWQQNSKTAQERQQLRKDVYRESLRSEEMEKELLTLLSRDGYLDNHHSTRELLQINSNYNNALESLSQSVATLEDMSRVQSSLTALAARAALISSVVMVMGMSLPLYAVSYDYMASVFLSFLEQAGGHIQGVEAEDKLTHYAYHHFSRGMLQQDRLLFAFTLTIQLELSRGIVTLHEVGYLLHPTPSTEYAVRGLAAQAGMDLHDVPTVSVGRRPYDWILESQWQAMLMLISHFPWAQKSMRLAFAEDAQGLQAQFRAIFQSIHSELFITTRLKRVEEKALKDGRNLIQILLFNSGNRPDRMMCSFKVISEDVLLPSKSSYDMPVELAKVYKSLGSGKVPLLLFHNDPHLPAIKIRALANKLHVPLLVLCVHGTGERELEVIGEAMARTSSEGGWLLIHNIQESEELLQQLSALLRAYPPSNGWRLWLSMYAGSVTSLPGGRASLPVALRNIVCRIALDAPTTLKSSLLYSLHSLPSDLLAASSRVEWLPLLHSCALLYAILCARREIHTISWSSCPPLPHTLLTDVFHYLKKVAGHSEAGRGGSHTPMSWSGLRHMLAEVFFGSVVCDPIAVCTLTSLIDTWIHPGGPRKEPGLYHIPAVFFNPGTRQSVLCQAVEAATPPPIVSPEICGLNQSPEIKIGHLEEFLPAFSSLTSVLHQHAPPDETDHTHWTLPLSLGRPQDLAHRHLLTPPVPILERLPSWVHIPSQIMELSLSKSQILVFGDIGSNIQNLRLPLETTIRNIQEILPHTGWREEVLSEKLSRHSSSLAFRHFLSCETSQMNSSLHTIHSSLLSLLRTLDPHSHGDPHTLTSTPHLSHLSISLLTHTVPTLWLESVGPTAAPPHWPLGEWIQDLALRWVFIDQVLSLGLAKVPTYWLGAFFHPAAFLSIITQSVLQSQSCVSGASEDTFFLAEVTTRNKDHIRDPPPDGELFVFGSYMWGCRLERSATIEFHDGPPKHSPTSLPLLHLVLTTHNSTRDDQTASEAAGGGAKGAESKANTAYHCPVFVNHNCREGKKALFHLLVHSPEVSPARWAVRSISCTLRPF